MNLTNFHSHCSYCDGRAPMEDFVKAAIDVGFTAYGVSSHAPLPFSTRWTLEQGEVPAYLEELDRLKKKYTGGIALYAGMEIDYLNNEHHPAMSFFQQLPLDFRIGSVHLIYTEAGEIIDTDTGTDNFRLLLEKHFQGDLKRMVEAYFEASVEMVKLGGFDFIGHADKIAFNAECCKEGVRNQPWYRKRREELFALVAEKGIRMEVNTKAWQNKGWFFPHQEYFPLIRELKIPVVVNSDAHFPELVNAGRPEALKALQEAGIETVSELEEGRWREKEIRY